MIDRLLRQRWRFPTFVNRAIDHVADNPMGLLGRLAALRLGRPAKDDATPTSVADFDRPRSVLIAPVNYSGQGHLWARALMRSTPDISAVNMAMDVPGGFSFPADLTVPVPVYQNGREWQSRQTEAVARFSHVLIEAEEPLFGRLYGRDVEREARVLRARGVNVAFMCHGTDIRLPSRHRELTTWSPYAEKTFYQDRLERLALRHRAQLEAAGRPVFVSTPDLLADVPFARWCPVVIDLEGWRAPRALRPAGERLRVVHSPSSAFMKGTGLIEPALEALQARGTVEYRAIAGVPSAGMPAVFRGADVVLDQFRLGSYGVAACEAMAAGAVVVGHVLDGVRERVRAETGTALPIVEATPDTLEEVLIELAGDPHRVEALQREGVAFVSAVHDGRLSARILRASWIDAPSADTPPLTDPRGTA